VLDKLTYKIFMRIKRLYAIVIYYFSKQYEKRLDIEIPVLLINKNYNSRVEQYLYFHHSFWHKSPGWLQAHRSYYKLEQRGFGEDSFHVMWYLLMKELVPKNMLEIGVYRGQVISLWALIAQKLDMTCDIHGISPFSSAGDNVSVYLSNIDYYADVLSNFSYFSLDLPHLHRGFSTDPEMVNIIESNIWDMIFIDGSHDYEVVKNDFKVCASTLTDGGIIVLDDSALYTGFVPPAYSTAGHPGPSILANEIVDANEFKEILSVGHNRVFQKIITK
jgi:hypothetical protein